VEGGGDNLRDWGKDKGGMERIGEEES
jgi:hypothetical protein